MLDSYSVVAQCKYCVSSKTLLASAVCTVPGVHRCPCELEVGGGGSDGVVQCQRQKRTKSRWMWASATDLLVQMQLQDEQSWWEGSPETWDPPRDDYIEVIQRWLIDSRLLIWCLGVPATGSRMRTQLSGVLCCQECFILRSSWVAELAVDHNTDGTIKLCVNIVSRI